MRNFNNLIVASVLAFVTSSGMIMAQIQSVPVVTTGPVVGVNPTYAQVVGVVSGGISTAYGRLRVCWGTSPDNLGQCSWSQQFGALNNVVPISGLNPASQYFYQVALDEGDRVVVGSIRSFVTPDIQGPTIDYVSTNPWYISAPGAADAVTVFGNDAPGAVAGSLALIQGTNLGNPVITQGIVAPTNNLPTQLDGVQVFLAGKTVPLMRVTPSEIVFVVPPDARTNLDLVVTTSWGLRAYSSAHAIVNLLPSSPAVLGVADTEFNLISQATPLAPSTQSSNGAPQYAITLAGTGWHAKMLPGVVVDGTIRGKIGFSGQMPGIAGINQVNVSFGQLAPGSHVGTLSVGGIATQFMFCTR